MRPSHGSSRAAVVSALVAVQVFFALHYVAARYIMDYVPPLAWATMRIVPAAGLLFGYALATRPRLIPRDRRELATIAWCSLFGVVINQICFVEGLARTSAAHSAIINTSIPVATLLIAILMRRERPTGRKLVGITLSLAGVLWLILHGGASLGGAWMTGDMLTLANAISYSFFLVISRPLLQRHNSLVVTALMLLFGAMGITAAGAPQLVRVSLAALPASVWWTGAFVVLFATVGAYILNAYALKRVDSSSVALFIYLQPVIAAAVAWAVRGERVGLEAVVAAAFIFAGVALSLMGSPATGPVQESAAPSRL
ncbi:MAG: DMT family transporter [Candidatus Polarisedimenticolia bacterium]